MNGTPDTWPTEQQADLVRELLPRYVARVSTRGMNMAVWFLIGSWFVLMATPSATLIIFMAMGLSIAAFLRARSIYQKAHTAILDLPDQAVLDIMERVLNEKKRDVTLSSFMTWVNVLDTRTCFERGGHFNGCPHRPSA